jgi:hypothetical protein
MELPSWQGQTVAKKFGKVTMNFKITPTLEDRFGAGNFFQIFRANEVRVNC